jgi:hypothetical protein
MEFVNSFKGTRSGFYHKSKLYFNGELLSEARASYLNRTWESYTYQAVMKDAVRNAIENEVLAEKSKRQIKRLTKSLRETIETESELIQLLKEKLKTL